MTVADGPTPLSSSYPPRDQSKADTDDDAYDAQGGVIVTANTLKEQGNDDHDGPDDHLPSLSGDAPRCDHCGQPASAAEQVRPYDHPDQPGVTVWLHGRCEEPWFDTQRCSDA